MSKGRPESQSSWADRAFSLGHEVKDEASGVVYLIRRFIGRGGMGEVYEAHRADTGAPYAIKCLRLEHVANARTIERTRREALTLRDLRHPNVVRVHATGVAAEGLIWMVMDLLEGHTLAQVKQRLGKLPIPWVLRIGRAVADGLVAVHVHAVHRDIKAENVHLGNDVVVRILDLGAGKFHRFGLLTTGGSTVGTVPYMSPEQLSVEGSVDARSDLFSLGVLLYELISGVHPFAPEGLARENVFTLVHKIIGPGAPSLREHAPWAPAHVVVLIDRATQKDRNLRFADAAQMGAALEAALAQLEREVGLGAPLETLVAELSGPREPAAAPPNAGLAPTVAAVAFADTDDAETLVMEERRRDK